MSKKGIQFDIDDYLKIDNTLSEITFDGISITGVVGHFIKKAFTDSPYYPYRIKDNILRIIFHFRFSKYLIYKFRRKKIRNVNLDRPYWFIINSTDPRLLGLVNPIINKLGRENCVLFSSEKHYLPKTKDIFHTYPVLNREEFKRWKSIFELEKVIFIPKLIEIKKTYHLSSFAYNALLDSIMYQSQLIYSFADMINIYRPKAITTDADRHRESAALISTGNHFNVPTYGMLHGSVFPPDSWIPFIAQKILCWGQSTYDHLKRYEVLEKQLVITGNPNISDLYSDINKIKIKQVLGEFGNSIVLISNNIELDIRLKLTEDFCKATKDIPLTNSFIRLHSAEDISEFESITAKYNHVKILVNSTLSLDETIYASKIVVINNSTVGIEALVKNKNVIVLDTIDYDIGLGNELCEKAYCLRAKSSEELRNHLNNLLSDEDLYQKQLSLSKDFVKDYCAYFGDESAIKISDLITQTNDYRN